MNPEPKRKYRRTRADLFKHLSNDHPLKNESRLRVHADCTLPTDRTLGTYGPTGDTVCTRCQKPAPRGTIVVAQPKESP